MYKRVFLGVALSLTSISVFAQNFEEIYSSFRKQTKEEYSSFRRQCNEEYAEFMKDAWRRFNGLPPKLPPTKDKPIPLTPYDKEKDNVKDKQLPYLNIVATVPPIPQPKPVEPIREQPQPMEKQFAFQFYGTKGEVRLTDEHRFTLNGSTEMDVANGWRFLSDGKSDNIIRDCLELRIRHGLCDWAYLQMLQDLGHQFFGENTNEATLLTAYLYCQSGYKMRLAHDKQRLYLLVACRHAIYNYKYFVINGESYYLLDKNNNAPLYICEASFPNEQALSLWMEQTPSLDMEYTDSRMLQSKRYPEMQAEVYTNKNLLLFFDSYPDSEFGGNMMTRWAMYAQTPLSKETRDKLYPALIAQLNGMSEEDAANRLLNFVQTAFEYGYDEEQWGKERAFFAEETMHYPYSDCEDRAILYSHLIRDLLGLDVALVYYPGHLATAVCFNEEVQGDYLVIDNRRFIICDPTYIDAPIGKSMPTVDSNNIMATVLKRNVYGKEYTIDVSADTETKDEVIPIDGEQKEPANIVAPVNEEQKDTANITKVKQSLFPICVDGKYGYQNAAGEIVVPCEYDSLSGYERGDRFPYAAHKDGKIDLYHGEYRGEYERVFTGLEAYIPIALTWRLGTGPEGSTPLVGIELIQKHYVTGLEYLNIESHYEWVRDDWVDVAGAESYYKDLDMDNVSYDNHVFENDEVAYIIVRQLSSNKWGVIHYNYDTERHKGREKIPFFYDSITFVKGNKSKVEIYNAETGKRKVVSLIEAKDETASTNEKRKDTANIVTPVNEEQKDTTNITKVKQSLFPICVDGKYGYQNAAGEIVVPCEYDSLSGYERGDKFPYAAHKGGLIDLYHGESRGEYEKVYTDIKAYIPIALYWRLGTGLEGAHPFVGIQLIKKQCYFWGLRPDEWFLDEWEDLSGITNSYEGLDMDNVSYDNHVFENDEVAYIIIRQLSSNKWGVIPYNYDSEEDKGKEKIPFIYDSITFVKDDKSKVEVYNAETGERKVISLIE